MPADPYNDSLFNGNRARRFLHERRFWWLIDRLRRLHIARADIIEIGCYDAKTITYLERSGIAVNRYVGYEADADIFDRVQAQWAARPEVAIVKSTSPSDIDRSATFDVGICMETLEHLPDELVDGYLQALAQVVCGPVFFTIPVERGAMLIAKQLGYRIFGMYGDRLTWHDLLNGAISRTGQIPRHEHTGFDDRQMVERIARYFDVTESGGLFVPYFTTLNFTLGIVGTANRTPTEPSAKPDSQFPSPRMGEDRR